jgi:hypothetical protein
MKSLLSSQVKIAKPPLPLGEDMEPYDPELVEGELGGVGEGVCLSGSAQPLTAATSDQRS